LPINWDLLRKLVEEADSVGSDEPVPRSIRNYVLWRDNYTCAICGRKVKSPHVHHINPGKPGTPENLVTLCRCCHQVVHCLLYVLGKHKFVNVIAGFKRG